MPTIAKKTSKNQLTIPKVVADRFPGVDYFEVSATGDRIVLKPVRPARGDEIRKRLAEVGIRPGDVSDAVAWARRRRA